MIFSSGIFCLAFLPACLLGYAVLSRIASRLIVPYLAMMSIVFYAAWNVRFAPVLLCSMLFNFAISRLIAASRDRVRTFWLTVGIAGDLSALAFFKYLFPMLNFITSVGWAHRSWGTVPLPLGISFFTFTQIAYLIDLAQGIAEVEPLDRFALFVTFFPHLIAGPILHHAEMMPQFRRAQTRLRSDDLALGVTWFTMGFFKKTMIADRISPAADALFANPHQMGAAQSWHGALVYSMQLYFDFSGYSDMAMGLARMFSIRFPMNFDSPYKAESIADFWQRWHMTLTRYIMNYVYAPIQMRVSRWRMDRGKKVSRKAQATFAGMVQMVAFPTLVTMFLAGIWHGAGMQFLVFGIMHGLFLIVNRAWQVFLPETGRLRRSMVTPVAVIITYLAVVSTEVMFRANSLHDALSVYAGLLGRHGRGTHVALVSVVVLAGLFAVVWMAPNTQEILGESQQEDAANWSVWPKLRWKPNLKWWTATAAALLLCLAYCEAGSTFLYFQF